MTPERAPARKTFDAYADRYGASVQSSIAFARLPHDFYLRAKAMLLGDLIEARFGARRLDACLDVGCGIGALHPHLAPLFDRITGVDVSRDSLARAGRDNPAGTYLAYDGESLPFAGEAFDLALAVCVLHHVPSAAWERFMAEMARVTRPGGLVAVIEHNPYNPLTRLAVSRCAFDHDAVLLAPGKTVRLLAGAGLRKARARHFLFLPSLAPAARAVEARLGRVPMGAQYLGVGVK